MPSHFRVLTWTLGAAKAQERASSTIISRCSLITVSTLQFDASSTCLDYAMMRPLNHPPRCDASIMYAFERISSAGTQEKSQAFKSKKSLRIHLETVATSGIRHHFFFQTFDICTAPRFFILHLSWDVKDVGLHYYYRPEVVKNRAW